MAADESKFKPSVVVELNPGLHRQLTRLLASGLYGDTIDEVAKHLLMEATRQSLLDNDNTWVVE